MSATPTTPIITADIQKRVAAIESELNSTLKQRDDAIHGMTVARVAQQHILFLGPGGTGKSRQVREFVEHIDGAVHFEIALDETTDPGQAFGPPDIPAMVKDGKNRRVVTGMLPEATDAFVDEIFNSNSPVLHSLMPIMNERIFHNNGMPSAVPLRCLYAGTNKLNADSDLAAFFDRLHLRYVVKYIDSRKDQADMVGEEIARLSVKGRGTGTGLATSKTMVTLAELDQAHNESLRLGVPDDVMDLFQDLHAELLKEGIVVSDRRVVEGMVAVLANAWIRGHEVVRASDLDILANMWWIIQDQMTQVRQIVLDVANPGEKAGLDLTKEFRKLEDSLNQARADGMDDERLRRLGVEMIRNSDKLLKDADEARSLVLASGEIPSRLDEVIDKVAEFKSRVGAEVFNLSADTQGKLKKA